MQGKTLCASVLLSMFAALTLVAPISASAQSELDRIVDRGYVRVGAVHAPPYYVKEPGADEWTGLVPDIVEAIFAQIDVAVRYVETDWGTAVAGLQADKFDMIGAYNATPERALAIDFTQPIGYLLVGLVTQQNNTEQLKSWDSLKESDLTVAAVDGAATTNAAERVLGDDFDWIRVKSNDQMLLELDSGKADAALSNHPTLIKYMDARGKGEMVIPEPQIRQPTNIGVRKTATNEFRDWLNVAIAYLESNKTLDAIWEKHLPTNE